jgi:hypothetical protein
LYFEVGYFYVAQALLELMILLPQPPGYWDYRCVASCPDRTWVFIIVYFLHSDSQMSIVALKVNRNELK